METILSPEQDELLKRTRDTLGRLRDMLADSAAAPEDRSARPGDRDAGGEILMFTHTDSLCLRLLSDRAKLVKKCHMEA